MKIADFTAAHIEQAVKIAKQNYDTERGFVPALPPVDQWPDLNHLTKNNLGVTALDCGDVVGFLCSYGFWNNAWDIPGLRHIYSPMGANGTVPENREKIYARLYQAAGEKWASIGAASQGYVRLGVDYESINPSVYGFWSKEFNTYAYGVERRIDEAALSKR